MRPSSVCRARAKNRSSDADHRRAFGDGCFKVVRHSYRQHIDVQALFAKLPKQRVRSCESHPLASDIGFRGGDRHQASQAQPRQASNGGGELTEFFGCDAGFARFTTDVDLQQYV